MLESINIKIEIVEVSESERYQGKKKPTANMAEKCQDIDFFFHGT